MYSKPYKEELQLTKKQAEQLNAESGCLVRVLSVQAKHVSSPEAVNKLKETDHLRMAVN